jgi:hypothetical protein
VGGLVVDIVFDGVWEEYGGVVFGAGQQSRDESFAVINLITEDLLSKALDIIIGRHDDGARR